MSRDLFASAGDLALTTQNRHGTKALVLNLQRSIFACLAAFGLLGSGYYSYSATTDNQQFQVTVPARTLIVAPVADPVQIYSGPGNANISFPRQDWSVGTNSLNGATVVLQTATCFHHATDTLTKRDGRLELRVNSTTGPALWAVTRASDTTNYASGDEDAIVQAISNKVGDAQLGLTVTFMTGIGADLMEGDYSLTVIGTITAN